MENEKIFELIEKMYVEMNSNMDKMYVDLKGDISEIKKTVIKIENEHGEKLEALLDGYKQNTEQLTKIEDEVSKHEEIILRKVK